MVFLLRNSSSATKIISIDVNSHEHFFSSSSSSFSSKYLYFIKIKRLWGTIRYCVWTQRKSKHTHIVQTEEPTIRQQCGREKCLMLFQLYFTDFTRIKNGDKQSFECVCSDFNVCMSSSLNCIKYKTRCFFLFNFFYWLYAQLLNVCFLHRDSGFLVNYRFCVLSEQHANQLADKFTVFATKHKQPY